MQSDIIYKLSDILINYSLDIQAKDTVWLRGDLTALPLLKQLYQSLIDKGSLIEYDILNLSWDEYLSRKGNPEQLAYKSPSSLLKAQTCNKSLYILATHNTRSLSGVPPQKCSLLNKRREDVLKSFMDRASKKELAWALSLYPCPAYAQEADMSLEAFQEMFYYGCFMDQPNPVSCWKDLSKKQQNMVSFLNTKSILRIETPDTKLVVNIKDMKWINCDGKRNFPDGEVYTGPNLSSPCGGINGYARFPFPTMFGGVVVEDIELEFAKGQVVQAKAKKNEAFLLAMLDSDEGAKFVGEIAIGTNRGLKTITKNILLDEKLGKTFHLALGAGYPETGNNNVSSLHWDLIGDLKGGRIFADDICIFENEKFSLEDWPLLS